MTTRILLLSTYYIVQWKIEPLKFKMNMYVQRNTDIFSRNAVSVACKSCQEEWCGILQNSICFFRRKTTFFFRGILSWGIQYCVFEGANTLRQTFFCTKCCLNNPFLKIYVLWFQVWRTRAKSLKMRNQNLGIPKKHQSNGVPEEVGDRAVFTVDFLWWLNSENQ